MDGLGQHCGRARDRGRSGFRDGDGEIRGEGHQDRGAACRTAPEGLACLEALRRLKNPYWLGDQPSLTQASGWLDAWTSTPSAFAVAAAKTGDVVAAVNFARQHNVRLVVKGGGHSYHGASSSADSLLIWTRAMNDVVLHDAFVPDGGAGAI